MFQSHGTLYVHSLLQRGLFGGSAIRAGPQWPLFILKSRNFIILLRLFSGNIELGEPNFDFVECFFLIA